MDKDTFRMERKLVNHNGTVITFKWVEKWGNYLMRSDYKDGMMHLMFISDVEKEIEMLMAEGYIGAKEWSESHVLLNPSLNM